MKPQHHRNFCVMLALVVQGLSGCSGNTDVNADGNVNVKKADLGRYLFYDKRLSGNGTLACASCHFQHLAFTDGQAVSEGSTGEFTPRNAQPLQNLNYHTTFTWANPSLLTLERQMEVPLFGENVVEMGVNDRNKAQILQRIASDPLYQSKFSIAFSGDANPVTWTNIIQAIATFERTLVSDNSRYDQLMAGKTTFTAEELRGKNLFFGEKAGCSECHRGFNFSDDQFHNIGLYNLDGKGAYPEPNRGVMELSGLPQDMGKFRTPSLRNIAVTAPYMHDGSVATLEAVLDIKMKNPSKPLALTPQDKSDLIAFLKTLTDSAFLTNPAFADPFTQKN